jgi:hypothetical protein
MIEGPFCLFQTVSQDAFCEEHTTPIDSLILFSESPAIVRLFGARRLVPTISSFLSRALKRCVPVYTRASLKWIVFGTCSLASLTGSSRPDLLCPSGRYSSRSRHRVVAGTVLAQYAGRRAKYGPPATGRVHARRSLRARRDRHLPTAVLVVSARSPSCRPPRGSHIS